MSFRALCIALSLATCTLLLGAERKGDQFRIPDPEEIFEAYQEGFIDYHDYRELLEITRREFLTPDDSSYLRQVPDLLTGLSSHPLIGGEQPAVMVDSGRIPASMPGWRHAALLRQYHRLESDAECRRLYRLEGEYRQVRLYGEYEQDYTGRKDWYRRSLAYEVRPDSNQMYTFTLGNFKERFGMGLIYGYHGRLLSRSGDAEGAEQFLYPAYSGSNGLFIVAERWSGRYRLVFDVDRCRLFEARLLAASIGHKFRSWSWELSGGRGRIVNRESGSVADFSLLSICSGVAGHGFRAIVEAAVTEDAGRWPAAGAAQFFWRRGRLYVRIDGWSYTGDYPSYFTGGPSSRRARTDMIDEIRFSWSDRYRGETGVIINTSYAVSPVMRAFSSLMLATRDFDDDRIETRVGLNRGMGRGWRAEIDCYWRSDRLYSEERIYRRIQMELAREGSGVQNRVVIGRRFETYPYRDDYLIMVSSRLRGARGAASASCKMDRLRWGECSNQYLYATVQYEIGISPNLTSFIKYSYRYRRGDAEGSYGLFRWDFRWVIL